MNWKDSLFEYLLRQGDNALILGQRLSEWVGHAPALEEEMATANVGLDLLGQAQQWLSYAGEVEGAGRDADALAFHRDVGQFRNALLVELPNGDYADTIARQFFFDVFHYHLLEALQGSADERISEIAAKSLKEVAYHVRRSSEWVIRMGDGTEESHERIQRSVNRLWEYTGELMTPDEIDRQLAEGGAAADLNRINDRWHEQVAEVLEQATLSRPESEWMQSGGKQGTLHTEHLGHLLAEMQFLQRAYPNAEW